MTSAFVILMATKSMTTEYYKWNSKKKEYILVPEMTVTMDK